MTIEERIFSLEPVYFVSQYSDKDMQEIEEFNNFYDALNYANQFDESFISPADGDYVWFSDGKTCNTIEQAMINVSKRACEDANMQQRISGGAKHRRSLRQARMICINNKTARRINRGHNNECPF